MSYTLTDLRMKKIVDTLETYRAKLVEHGRFDAGSLEHELRKLLDTGYQELKEVAEQLVKNPRYREVGAYYLQHSGHAPSEEAKGVLAELYGVKSYDNAKDLDERRDSFWDEALRRLREPSIAGRANY